MSEQAKWRNKIFGVSEDAIKVIKDLALSYSIKAETNDDLEYTPATNERGREPVPLSFAVKLDNVAGIDVRKEIEDWEGLVEKTGFFYLAGRRLGPFLQLQNVDVSVSILDDFGNIRSAELALSFLEHANDMGVADLSGPSREDKSRMRPGNMLLSSAKKTGFDLGAKIKILGNAYATGEEVPAWVKETTCVISQVKPDKVLVQPINSWIYISDATLVV